MQLHIHQSFRGGGLALLLALCAPALADKPNLDIYGDPLPPGAVGRLGTVRWRHAGAVYFVGFAAEGKELITASLDGSIRVWEVPSGKLLRRWSIAGKDDVAALGQVPGSVVLSADRQLLAATSPDGQLRLWHVAEGKPAGVITPGEPGRVVGANGLACSPDGKLLVSREDDHVLRVWDMTTGKMLRQLGERGNGRSQVSFFGRIGNTMAFAPDGKALAVMNSTVQEDGDGVITLWDVNEGKEIRRIGGGPGSLGGRLAYGPGVLAVFWGNRTIRLYDAETGKELHQLANKQDEFIVNTLLFAPDGKTLAIRTAANSPAIQLWDVSSGKELRKMGEPAGSQTDNVFINHTGIGSSCATIAFSPDGMVLAEALPTGVVRFWKVAR